MKKNILTFIVCLITSIGYAQLPLDSLGYTILTPSADSRIVYVSNSDGDDAWSGLAPSWNGTDGPKKNIHSGFALLRNGKPDWLLLKRGDTWKDQSLATAPGGIFHGNSLNGRNGNERIVISSYGSSIERPTLEYTHSQRLFSVKNVAIVGLKFYNYKKDPSRPEFNGSNAGGFSMLYTNKNILIEDNHFIYTQLTAQSITDINGAHLFDSIAIRKNIIEKAYSIGSHQQGIYSSTGHPGYLLIEDNVFDHNGWCDEFSYVLTAPNSDVNQWKTITNGRVGVELNGQTYNIDSLDFSLALSMADVASILDTAIDIEIGQAGVVQFKWSDTGNVFFLQAATLPSNSNYKIKSYSGSAAGTDLEGALWFNNTSQGNAHATVFNRNMYLSHGYGTTTVRGNIDANGASGGIQLRMGGISEDNLILRAPLALTYGHPENPGNSIIGGSIRNNVVLGARDISTAPRGFGIAIASRAVNSAGTGSILMQNVTVSNNIIAHNELGTGNILGLGIEGTGAFTNVDVSKNIVYDWAKPVWPNANDNRANTLSIEVVPASVNVTIRDNHFQQPGKGYVATASYAPAGVSLSNNTYFSTSPNPSSTWSTGWFNVGGSNVTTADWVTQMNDTSMNILQVPYIDPNRKIETYMASLGYPATYEAFIEEAKKQSKLNFRNEFTAYAVNCYIRDGFRTPITFSHSADSSICAGSPITLKVGNINRKKYTLSWDGGQTYTNDTTFTVSPAVSGVYSLIIADSAELWLSCEPLILHTFSVTVNTCTGIEEATKSSALTVSPNPNKGDLQINMSIDKPQYIQLYIYNSLGTVVYNKQVWADNKFKYNVDLTSTGFAEGVYIIKAQGEDVAISERFLLMR